MKSVVILCSAFAVMNLSPFAGMTVFGQADSSARVGDKVGIEISVEQIDQATAKIQFAVPYPTDVLKFGSFEDYGFQGGECIANDVKMPGSVLGSVNLVWTGNVPAGGSGSIGKITFDVTGKRDEAVSFTGVNPSGMGVDGTPLSTANFEMVASASVSLIGRPIRVLFDLIINQVSLE